MSRDQWSAAVRAAVQVVTGLGVLTLLLLQSCGPSPVPPVPPVPPPHPPDPRAGIVRIQTGGSGCTASVLGDRFADGTQLILTAKHCVSQAGTTGRVRTITGQTYDHSTLYVHPKRDVAVLMIRSPEALAHIQIAPESPPVGTKVWHEGWGVDRPGNHEAGEVVGHDEQSGELVFRLSVSSGDSGSGIIYTERGEIVSVVCCTSGGRMFGPDTEAIRETIRRAREIRTDQILDWDWTPLPIPERKTP